MTVFRRYAIYWTPEPGSELDIFGEQWFGPSRETFGLASELAERARWAPAKYGLHATLKAPFRLAQGVATSDLQRAIAAFSAVRRAPRGGPLRLAQFQNYLGLVLSGHAADFDWLAAECVTHFDRFRASPGEVDRSHFGENELTAGEVTFAQTFGYPYVLSAFRFHISLAGPLPVAELREVARVLEPWLSKVTTEPMTIAALSLLGEREDGTFEIISRHRFLWAGFSPKL